MVLGEYYALSGLLGEQMEKDRWRDILTLVVAFTITGAWAISFGLDIVLGESYDPPASITPLMLVVAGYCFSDRFIPKKNKAAEETEV